MGPYNGTVGVGLAAISRTCKSVDGPVHAVKAARGPGEGLPRAALLHRDLVRTIKEHNEEWSTWFAEVCVEPYVVTYEDLVTEPRRLV
jgi:hypothetical protein